MRGSWVGSWVCGIALCEDPDIQRRADNQSCHMGWVCTGGLWLNFDFHLCAHDTMSVCISRFELVGPHSVWCVLLFPA